MSGGRGSIGLLVAGMVVGAALAAAGVAGGPAALEGAAVIDGAEYERALRALAGERRGPLSLPEARHVLERLVDEELLVRHGLAIGLAERDPRVRAELSAAVIGLIVGRAEAEARAVSEATLRGFFEERAEAFRAADSYRLTHVGVAQGQGARASAEALRARLLAGEGAAAVRPDGAVLVVELPMGWVSGDTVLEYLGPSVTRAVVGLEEGGVSEVIGANGGYHVVRLEARRVPSVPAFDTVESEVRAAYQRWFGDRALARFLREQRRGVAIEVAGR